MGLIILKLKKHKYIKWDKDRWKVFGCNGLTLIGFLKYKGYSKQQITKALEITSAQLDYFLRKYNNIKFNELKRPNKFNKIGKMNKTIPKNYLQDLIEKLKQMEARK